METRCKDCSDGHPCMRILCEYCFYTQPLGALVPVKDKPKEPLTPEESLEWVRSLNPSKYREIRVQPIHPRLCHAVHPTQRGVRCTHIEGHSGAHYDLVERSKWTTFQDGSKVVSTTEAGRLVKKVYTPVALRGGGESKLKAHSPNCADERHSHCTDGWCECVCHDSRKGSDPTKEMN